MLGLLPPICPIPPLVGPLPLLANFTLSLLHVELNATHETRDSAEGESRRRERQMDQTGARKWLRRIQACGGTA